MSQAPAHPKKSQAGRARSNLMLFTAEWSTTPLGFACLFGSGQLVKLLLESQGAWRVFQMWHQTATLSYYKHKTGMLLFGLSFQFWLVSCSILLSCFSICLTDDRVFLSAVWQIVKLTPGIATRRSGGEEFPWPHPKAVGQVSCPLEMSKLGEFNRFNGERGCVPCGSLWL